MFPYEPEFNQIVSLITNKFKSDMEIFLHQLICNSSHALDKLQYETTDVLRQNSNKIPPLKIIEPPSIQIIPNKTNNALTIVDDGPGMTWPDFSSYYLGNIGRSRSKDLMEAFAAGDDVAMIGQLGFGFYFAFLVADKVVVRTKHPHDFHYIWETQAGGSFTRTRDTNCRRSFGGSSRMTLYLKEDELEYLEEVRLKDLIIKRSVTSKYPISLAITKFGHKYKNKTKKVKITDHSNHRIVG